MYENMGFKSDSKFLITGGAGFIGSNLCEALVEMGYQVICIDNLSTGSYDNMKDFIDAENFTFIEGDIKDYEICLEVTENVDFVLHQAATGSVPKSMKMPVTYGENNVIGTLNLLEASRQNGVSRVVFASSSSVYGDNLQLPKEEDSIGNALSPYALTKQINESYAALYSQVYGLETIGLRYFNVFGKRQNPKGAYAAVIPKFIQLLMEGKQASIYGDGLQSRDFTYIENVIEANLRACLAESKYVGQVFNIACGEATTILDLYWTIARSLGVDIEPMLVDEREGDIKHSKADVTKAISFLGYNAKWTFSEGIKATIEWYRR